MAGAPAGALSCESFAMCARDMTELFTPKIAAEAGEQAPVKHQGLTRRRDKRWLGVTLH